MWIVVLYSFGEDQIAGVYSSLESAEAKRKFLEANFRKGWETIRVYQYEVEP